MEILIIGNTWEFEYLIRDNQGKNIDLSTYAIRAVIKDNTGTIIKIANNKVGGGSANDVVGYDSGKLNLVFPAAKTALTKDGNAQLEAEITSPDGKRYTVIQDSYVIKSCLIDWDSVN